MHVHNSLDLKDLKTSSPTNIAWAQMLTKLRQFDQEIKRLQQENQDLWIDAQQAEIEKALLEAEVAEMREHLKKKQVELDTLTTQKIPIKVTPRSDHEDEILSFYKRNNIPRPSVNL